MRNEKNKNIKWGNIWILQLKLCVEVKICSVH
jgi:hypothetical protein